MTKSERFATTMVLLVPAMLWSGFVITKLWGWFVVPLGFKQINWAMGLGISLLTTLLRLRAQHLKEDSENTGGLEALISCAIAGAFLLGLGWIVQHWAVAW